MIRRHWTFLAACAAALGGWRRPAPVSALAQSVHNDCLTASLQAATRPSNPGPPTTSIPCSVTASTDAA